MESVEVQFRNELYKKYAALKKVLIPRDEYYATIEELKVAASESRSKTHHQYYLLSRYEVLQCGDVEKLIKKRKDPADSPMYFVTIEDTFDIIKRAHITTGHGGRDRMVKELSKKYVNITSDSVNLYKSLCIDCQRKRKRPTTKGVVVRPILTKDYSSRGQVDLVDMQSMSQGPYKWILVYQDHLTKFCVLRPLTSKRAAEVAYQLFDIFLTIGAPHILQSDNGAEFTASVITELKELWDEFMIVHGKPRHPQSQGSVERANGDIKDMLVAWMSENKTSDWTVGIKLVQFSKNASYHSGIKQSPFSALFGMEPQTGLRSTNLPNEVLERLQSEDDLLAVFQHPTTASDSGAQPSTTASESGAQPSTTASNSGAQPSTTARDNGAQPSTTASDSDTPNTLLQERKENILRKRAHARDSQLAQAERMVKRSKVVMIPGLEGDNVAVPIPSVDRGRGDPRNILGIIVSCDEKEQYTIACPSGILKGKYSRNQFDLLPQRLLSHDDVNTETVLSLRQAVHSESNSGGQGFIKCNCSGSKKCQTKRCKCFKNNLKCNSRCHSSLNCPNK